MNHPQYMPRVLWALDLPAENDSAFTLFVLEKIERRRFRKKMQLVAAVMFTSLCALVVAAPALEILLQDGFTSISDVGVWVLAITALAIALIETPGSPLSEGL